MWKGSWATTEVIAKVIMEDYGFLKELLKEYLMEFHAKPLEEYLELYHEKLLEKFWEQFQGQNNVRNFWRHIFEHP